MLNLSTKDIVWLNSFRDKLFSKQFIFEEAALQLFRFQYRNNDTYQEYCKLLGVEVASVNDLYSIPFMPISAFKDHKVLTAVSEYKTIFESSGTTSSTKSKHYVYDLSIYEDSFLAAFKLQYGNPKNYSILALLPSYLERDNSSLVFMVNRLIEESNDQGSGFFLNDFNRLNIALERAAKHQKKTLLIGVSFALLDFAEQYLIEKNSNLIVMETGGMKGRRKELIREELHEVLSNSFKTTAIHSEYGMTELLSQAYSKGKGIFACPPWMRVIVRQQDDPLNYELDGVVGGVNVIDLANIFSCAFIQTQDLGKITSKNQFEIVGRFDASEVRGCNLLVI